MGVTAKERVRPASVAVAGSIPAISTRNGSLAHCEERRCEVAQVRGSSPRGTTTRMSFNGRTSGFHPENESSILSIRSTRR